MTVCESCIKLTPEELLTFDCISEKTKRIIKRQIAKRRVESDTVKKLKE